ncbi:MAG: hypothetical protein ACKO38_18955 [Planctomycetota bacterium]
MRKICAIVCAAVMVLGMTVAASAGDTPIQKPCPVQKPCPIQKHCQKQCQKHCQKHCQK